MFPKSGSRAAGVVLHFLLLISCATCSKESETPKAPQVLLPSFFLISRTSTCSLDSPQIYINKVALPNLNSTLEEGKVFFGVLLDQLHSSLEGSDELTGKLEEDWEKLTDLIMDSFDMTSQRIRRLWTMIVEHYETETLPWETRLKSTVLFELFAGLGHEYLVLDAMVKTGARQIMNTLQGYLTGLIKRLEVKMLGENVDQSQANATELMLKMEEAIGEEEPTFVGRLLVRMFRRAKEVADGTWRPPQVTFLERTLEQVAILIESFKVKGQEYGREFWRQMTHIMHADVGSRIPMEKLYVVYSSSESHVLNTLLSLLSA